MTQERKDHKIKLIQLIIMVNTEYARRKPFKNIFETLAFATEQVMWAVELRKVSTQKTFENDGLTVIGENKQHEKIQRIKNTILK